VKYLSPYFKVLGFVAKMSLMLWLTVKGREPTVERTGQSNGGAHINTPSAMGIV
jgi:hypothetical protein